MTEQLAYKPGLEGIIASETNISYLDVEKEEIVIRGYDLIELAQKKTFLETAYLLIYERLPDSIELHDFEQVISSHAAIHPTIQIILKQLPKTTHPMDAMRTCISVLAGFDEKLHLMNLEHHQQRAVRLLGQLPTIVAGSYHILNKDATISPDTNLTYTENFLYMLTGRIPSKDETTAFDQTLTLYSEHELPNSTFAARVIASTHADMYGAFTGAISSLKGNLHGGANEAVMYMLLEGKTVEGFTSLIEKKLTAKEKIMGFGHRVYMRKMDPRAALLKRSLKALSELKGDRTLYDMCVAGEELMKEKKNLYPNLDYYAAPIYYVLGIPISLYTPIFFASRASGLAAHVIEQHLHNRIFRPRVRYLGARGLTLSNK
ncbi:citrate synthase [Bacillus sp. NPDC077027]|uniref:citrate synthase n=1 Tax=Bacillus sp. NPDC077027 TaxID=3390548 RepID=UPI003D08FDF8